MRERAGEASVGGCRMEERRSCVGEVEVMERSSKRSRRQNGVGMNRRHHRHHGKRTMMRAWRR
jgi:hypothetical protein